MTIEQFGPPQFVPLQLVKVIALGMAGYPGRLIECVLTRGGRIYDVEYLVEGEYRSRRIYADELKAAA